MPVCEKCNFEMPHDSLFCGKCGNKLTTILKKKCSCGNEENADLFFCENCGKLLPESTAIAGQTSTKEASNTKENDNQVSRSAYQPQSQKQPESYSPPPNPLSNIDINAPEKELLKISVVTLPTGGINFTIGTFIITTRSVYFEPVWGDKKTIPAEQIASVSRTTHNITAPAIEITEKNNKKTIFVFVMHTYADNAAKTLNNLLALYPH